MLSPIVGGLLFDFVGYSFAAIFIAGWNLVSVIVEYLLLILIYRFVYGSEMLFISAECALDLSLNFLFTSISSCRDFPDLARKDHLDKLGDTKDSIGKKLKRSLDSWVMFYRHPVFFAGIALSSTYMTVLGLDNGT